MHHSEAKFSTAIFFSLEVTSGFVDFFNPLETQWMWMWLAIWLASQLRGCSPSHFCNQLQLCNIWFILPHLPLSIRQATKQSGQDSGTVGLSSWSPLDMRLAAWGLVCYNGFCLGERLVPSVGQDLGWIEGGDEFLFTMKMERNPSSRVRLFYQWSLKIKQWRKDL